MKSTTLRKITRIIALATVSVLIGASPAAAQIVSLNIVQNPGNDNQQIDADEAFGLASLGSVVGGWHNLNAGVNDLANSLGAPTTLDVAMTQPNGQATFNAAYADTPIFAGLDDYTTTANPVSITLSDLNATFTLGYYAIVYAGGFNANTGASISDGTSTFYYRPDPAPVAPYGSFAQTTQTTDLGAGNNPIAQYAVFGSQGSPLTADSITFRLDTLFGGGAALGGVQIVAVPEPAAGALLLSGMVFYLAVRRREI